MRVNKVAERKLDAIVAAYREAIMSHAKGYATSRCRFGQPRVTTWAIDKGKELADQIIAERFNQRKKTAEVFDKTPSPVA